MIRCQGRGFSPKQLSRIPVKTGLCKAGKEGAGNVLSVFRCDDNVDDQFKILTENMNLLLFSTAKDKPNNFFFPEKSYCHLLYILIENERPLYLVLW